MFNFRLINTKDGAQIIDTSLKTPYDSITAVEMLEYMEVEEKLEYMERIRRKKRKEAEQKRRIIHNPFWRFACFCGLI